MWNWCNLHISATLGVKPRPNLRLLNGETSHIPITQVPPSIETEAAFLQDPQVFHVLIKF